mmetsp:Transcript_14765/g.27163  ORF Transcript_14765/g.27163 Transcript_14765/m.27163 type:complete len:249 (+) Transcript_14765:47-793(+)
MSQNINPRVIGRLNKELKQLVASPPEGVRFVPGDMDTLTEVHVEMDGPEETPYEGGTFRMKLVLGQDYPQAPPRGFFLTKIYHPNVSSNGDICVNTLKKDWNDGVTLCHILAVIRCLLIIPFPESSLNDEAGKLFMDSYDDYAERAKLMTNVHAKRTGGVEAPSTSKDTSRGAAEDKAVNPAGVGLGGSKAANKGGAGSGTAGEAKENGGKKGSAGNSATSGTSEKPSSKDKAAAKQKENKKKSLKRL